MGMLSIISNDAIANTLGLTTTDLQGAVVDFINVVLGLLSLVSWLILAIGGFRWMVTGRNDELRAQAKRMIVGAVVGQIFVMLSWAIVVYVAQVIK